MKVNAPSAANCCSMMIKRNRSNSYDASIRSKSRIMVCGSRHKGYTQNFSFAESMRCWQDLEPNIFRNDIETIAQLFQSHEGTTVMMT